MHVLMISDVFFPRINGVSTSNEGFRRELLAQETPVVAVSRMGTRDVLDGAGGCRVVPEDPAAFAARVSRLLEEGIERDELRAAARPYATSWSAGAMAGRLAELYADIAAGT